MAPPQTFWNGEPCEARRVTLVVADAPEFPAYWARPYVGQERDAVEVVYGGQTFYLDDDDHEPSAELEAVYARHEIVPPTREAGDGWAKVTDGRGSPRVAHGNLEPAPESVRARGS